MILSSVFARSLEEGSTFVMKKFAKTGRLADTFHKGFVVTCIGLTLYGMLIVGTRAHAYYTQLKPQRLRERELADKEALEQEQTDDAETLKL